MIMTTVRFTLLTAFLLGLAATPVRALDPTEAQKKQVKEIGTVLLKNMKKVEGKGLRWPPDIQAISDEESRTQYKIDNNAFAWWDVDTGQPHVRITGLYLKGIKGDPDVLAQTLAHELGHIHHRHSYRKLTDKAGLVTALAFSRNMELEADTFGADLMKQAGFSIIHAIRKKALMLHETGRHRAPLEAVRDTHPAWTERFGRVIQNEKVWEALAAFDNGVVLLSAQQYFAAERCFEKVTRFDEKCYEAWVDLGYARLMQYCDKLSPDDLESMGVGQVVCGGFYRRAKTIEPPVRGKDARLWRSAVAALTRALEIHGDLPLARLNLGLAYLVHPEKKESALAAEQFQTALKQITGDTSLDPLDRIAFHVNLAVALLDGDTRKEGVKQLDRARELLGALGISTAESLPVDLAIRYNRALALAAGPAADDKSRALNQFESYLQASDPRSAWWGRGYSHYLKLCKELKVKPRDRELLENANQSQFRMQLSLMLSDGKTTVALGEKTEEVVDRLGEHTVLKVLGGELVRYRFPKHNVEIVSARDTVLAIVLNSKHSPALVLKPRTPGTGRDLAVRVGMSRKELMKLVPETGSAVGRDLFERGSDESTYRYFRPLGLAMRFDADYPGGNITEIVLVQVD